MILFVVITGSLSAQGPRGKDLGFGLVLGEPTGLTLKYWLNKENALNFDLGNSFFGATRIDIDYLWHFDAFSSKIIKMTAGFGGVFGIGRGNDWWYHDRHGWYYRDGGNFGFGVRGLIGLNIIPKKAPIELFLNLGVLVGIHPDFGSGFEGSAGIRFYP